jgi:hypothetical protein
MKKPIIALFLSFLVVIPAAHAKRVINNNVSVREGAGAFYPVLSILNSGAEVEIVQDGLLWKKIKLPDGTAGWISANAFNPAGTAIDYGAMAEDTASRSVSQIMMTAAVKGFFDSRIRDTGLNQDLLLQPFRRYVTPAEYTRFTEETYVNRWGPQMFQKKNKIEQKGAFTIDENLVAVSASLVGKLTADGLSADRRMVVYVNSVAQLVTEATEFYDLPVCVHVVATDALVANAAPIGVLVISEGMLKLIRDESELACLIAHEISHVTLGHAALETDLRKPVLQAETAFAELDAEAGVDPVEIELDQLYLELYEQAVIGRKFEYEAEADSRGLIYARRAGYRAEGMLSLLKRLKTEMPKNKRMKQESHWQPFTIEKRIAALEPVVNNALKSDSHYVDFYSRFKRNAP